MNDSKPYKHYRTCNLCEAMCGVTIEVEDEEILSIKGDINDPFSKGHICPKALALKDFHEDPDRLRQPQLKTDEGWKSISWDQAFDIVGSRIRAIRQRDGENALGSYLGNPNAHHHGNILFALIFEQLVHTKNRFSATSNDQLPHMMANLEMFGHQLLFPIPDIDHTDLFILIGSNPAASNGSVTSAPDYQGRLKAIRKHGGESILIDPRKTETARSVDHHLFIKPGTDALMLLGMLHTLFDESLVETGRLTSHLDDLVQIQLLCSEYSADYVAPLCGMRSDDIKTLARKLASTPRACLFGRMGTSVQEFGGLATWLVYVINVLTNHLDERGGLMFTKPAADLVALAPFVNFQGQRGTYTSKTGLPEFSRELPANTMADQILLPGEDQIKAMIVTAGNPVSSSPNSKRLDKAFSSLEFMVSIDSYINETSRHADVILPPTSHLEQSHYDLAFNMLSIRNVAKFSPALFEPPKHAKHDWQILLELTRRIAPKDIKSRLQTEVLYQGLKRLGADGVLDLILRSGPYGTQLPGTSQVVSFLVDALQDLVKPDHPLRRLLDIGPYGAPNRGLSKGLCTASLLNYPHGIDLGSLQSSLPERLFTQNKRIKLAPSIYLEDLPRLRKRASELEDRQENEPDTFTMIGRRHVRSNNSWLHNSHRLVKGKNRCTMLIHPDDASALSLSSGELARVSNHIGSIDIETEVSEEIMPGVISIPHGWGQSQKGVQLSIAKKQIGVNINDLTDDHYVDKLCGTSVLNGLDVKVSKIGTAKAQNKNTSSTTKKRNPAKASG